MDFYSGLYGLSSLYSLSGLNGLGSLDALTGFPALTVNDSFLQSLQKALNGRYGIQGIYGVGDTDRQSNAEKYPGDVLIQTPPDFSGLQYDESISQKSKADMTLDEYKQYFLHEMSEMPVSGYYRATFHGTLMIQEEAFERMKKDPEYEDTIKNMLREGFSVQGIYAGPAYGYQVIGDSAEKCHGFGVPAAKNTKKEESWWGQRHERHEEFWQKQQEHTLEDKAVTKAYRSSRQSADIAKIYANWQKNMGFTPGQPLRTPDDTVAEIRQMISAAELLFTGEAGKTEGKR